METIEFKVQEFKNMTLNPDDAVADHLRKLPMSFFNTKDLSELTTSLRNR